ncbi:MAG: hypothetical protein ACI86H_001115 [bacterium]|jgi:hypothetical protein
MMSKYLFTLLLSIFFLSFSTPVFAQDLGTGNFQERPDPPKKPEVKKRPEDTRPPTQPEKTQPPTRPEDDRAQDARPNYQERGRSSEVPSERRGRWGKQWRWATASRGDFPRNAVRGGYERGKTLYICRAFHSGAYHPGKIGSGFSGCNIGWGGREIQKPHYQVLTGKRFYWKYNNRSRYRSGYNNFVAGREKGQPLYICRAYYRGGKHPGKYRSGFRGCNIGWGGREVTVQRFEILTRR